jgi:predicted enzyme related to lactoylglutathione lyase
MKNVISWFEIYTTNFERAKKFYSEVFGYKLEELPMASGNHPDMRYAVFSNEGGGKGVGGALVRIKEVTPGHGGTMVYFDTNDIDAELSRVETAGGKIVRWKQSIGEYGFIALVEDSEGNMIGLRSMK